MIENTKPKPGEWNQTDAFALRSFLINNPKFLTNLRKGQPRSRHANTRDEAANQGQQNEGYLQALDKIEEMMQDKAPSPPAGTTPVTPPATGL